MAELKAKRKLQEVSLRWSKSYTPDTIIGTFKNNEKYTHERLLSILKSLFKPHIADFDKHHAQFEADIKKNKKTTYEAFIIFLTNATVLPAVQKPQIADKPQTLKINPSLSVRSDFESPTLSSTRVDNGSNKAEVVVSEVN
jgi:NAD-dependent SIR2 family protein deacetylase